MFQPVTDAELENRYTYHAPKSDQPSRYASIRDNTPTSREQSLAFNALDQVMFLANAAIARNEK